MKRFQLNRSQRVGRNDDFDRLNSSHLSLVPGIGKKYGQILANHGFIYARQLLGYYLILKDNEMFRKWLQYQFQISKFRAAESKKTSDVHQNRHRIHEISSVTSALNEMIRRTL